MQPHDSDNSYNAHNSKTYMEALVRLNPDQRLQLIKKMTVEVWRLQLWPQIVQQILLASEPRILSLLPYPTLTSGLHAPLPGSSSGLLSPPVRANAPTQQNIYGTPYMEAIHHPRAYNPALPYQPYHFYSYNNNSNWRMPAVVYQLNGVGPIRNRHRLVVVRHGNGDLYTYEENNNDDNLKLQ